MKRNADKDVAPVTGAPQPALPSPWELRTRTFRCALPVGWHDRSVYCVAGTAETGSPPTIAVTSESVDAGTELRAYVDDQIYQLAGQLLDFQLKGRQVIVFAGRDACRVQFTWTDGAGGCVSQSQWCVILEGKAVAITATARGADAEQDPPEIAEALKSFEFLLPPPSNK